MTVTAEPAAPLLTIGLGTHDRAESVTRVIDALIEAPQATGLDVLVVDDASSDGTDAALTRLARASDGRLRTIRHRERGGFGGALATLIAGTRSPWLMLTSDDDVVLTDSLPGLLAELEGQSAGILVPGFLDGERGDIRSKPSGHRIHPGKVWGTLGHAPGIVFDVAGTRRHLGVLRALLDAHDPFAIAYPQVVLGVELACEGRPIVHWSTPVAATGEDNPSGIRDPQGEPYWAMSARMRQFFAFQTHLRHRADESTGPERQRFLEVLEWNRVKLVHFFAAWLTVEHPDHAEAVRSALQSAPEGRFARAVRALAGA